MRHARPENEYHPVHRRYYSWKRHMLVLTLIARTTLLSPSAAHRQSPRPSHLLLPRPLARNAFRFTRRRAASCPVSTE